MRGLFALLAVVAAGALGAPLLADGSAPQPPAGETSTARPPAAPPVPAETVDVGHRTLRMTVPVTVAGRGPYEFLIDTGAERSVVSHELAQALALDQGPTARMFDFAGISSVSTVRVPSLSAGTLATGGIEAPSLAMADIGAPGMLGIDALQGHRVVIDFDRNQMLLMPAKRHAQGDVRIRAARGTGQLVVTKAWYEGTPIAVVIDTGSWPSVGNQAMRALVTRTPRSLGRISVKAVSGRSFDADYVVVPRVKIGGITFEQFALAFADAPPFERFGLKDKPALILGLSSLKLFRRVELDFVNREVAFTLPRPRVEFLSLCRGMAACKRFGTTP